MPHQDPRLPAIHPTDSAFRRLLDAGIALLLLVALSWLFALVALAVKLTSRGSLFYRQKRVGQDGKLFEICKFRTMYPNADRHGPSVTSADDSRITPIGRRLRNWKLDELPQLFNVLKGEMSLVGPRPQVPRFVDCFDPCLRSIVLHVRPGITGPTALHFRHEETMLADQPDRETFYIEKILPVKLEMDVQYVQTRSLRKDLRILTETVWLFSLGSVKRVLTSKGLRKHHAALVPDAPTETAERAKEDALGAAH